MAKIKTANRMTDSLKAARTKTSNVKTSNVKTAAQPKAIAPVYTMRRPGRPKQSEVINKDVVEQAAEEGQSLRFEMRLPPGIVADLELMRDCTGNTFAGYIRQAILRALAEDKKNWIEK